MPAPSAPQTAAQTPSPTAAPATVSRRATLGWIAAAIAMCVAFALFTEHRWEDYYITLRASRNLVEGNGLVFQPGERVHSFTSPIGVLLPAASMWLAGGREAEAATLWIFRAMCIAALAGATAGVHRIARRLGWPPLVAFLLPALLLTDAKSVDFTVNGMETAFMLLCLAATVNTLLSGGRNLPWKLGACWAALMWTRPDGFIFGGAVTLAWLLWSPGESGSRRERFFAALRAVPIAALLYVPWFAWAWWYYGSPVPHTIVAKGLSAPQLGLAALPEVLLRQTVLFPWSGGVRDAFLPAYVWFGGWPAWVKIYAIGAAWVCLLYFLWPRASQAGRTFSFTFFLCSLYGTAAPAAPWYVPSHALFAFLTIGAIVADAAQLRAVRLAAVGHLAACTLLLGATAWQLHHQQRLIETQRAELGRWLKHASQSPRDTVWLECLGYIGYFSELKMLDFPGLCAPEVVHARRVVGNSWPVLIRRLQPDWLVLRRNHREAWEIHEPELVRSDYELVRSFDVADEVAKIRFLPGRAYLEQDQTFDVYRRRAAAAR